MKRIIRKVVENVLSRIKAGFKSILNFEHPFERKKINNQNNQKRSLTLSTALLALTLTVTALWVSPVWAQEVPQYGGTYTSVITRTPESWEPVGAQSWYLTHFEYEDLGMGDWTVDRDEFDFTGFYVPREYQRGLLAESWEQPDAGTIIFHIRKGVHWHNKPPANGRELTAHDVEWSWHRLTGLGSGFTEPHPNLEGIWKTI